MPKVKLPRTQGRWSYKTTPKPRVVIRKHVEEGDTRATLNDDTSTTESSAVTVDDGRATATTVGVALAAGGGGNGAVPNAQRKELTLAEYELDPSESEDVATISVQDQQQQQQHAAAEQIVPVETLNVEISTAADLDNVYFEIATIKSPYSFQVNKKSLPLSFSPDFHS